MQRVWREPVNYAIFGYDARMALLSVRACVAAVDAPVVHVTRPCRDHVCIECVVRDFPASTPGQFLQIRCGSAFDLPPHALEWANDGLPRVSTEEWSAQQAFVRRPFSIADRWDEPDGAHLKVISRAIGPGTRWLDHVAAGGTLNITGPLGRGFTLPDENAPLVLIGGGVGIPPLLYLCRALAALKREAVLIIGAMRGDLVPVELRSPPAEDGNVRECAVLPASARIPVMVTTDDGSLGLRGRTTDGLRALIARQARFRGAVVLACGPEPMLEAIARLTRETGNACQLCIERTMGCGLGTCLSCVVKVRDGRRVHGWRWALSCTEGPVFERDELVSDDEVIGIPAVAAQ